QRPAPYGCQKASTPTAPEDNQWSADPRTSKLPARPWWWDQRRDAAAETWKSSSQYLAPSPRRQKFRKRTATHDGSPTALSTLHPYPFFHLPSVPLLEISPAR